MGTEIIPVEETEAAKPSELEEKIIRQVEYYFGNYNLARDKFLKEQIKEDDGWVPLETLIKFNRLKELTVDFQVISDALKKSPHQVMEVNEDITKIRRKVPFSENEDKSEIEDRSLYVKGFHRDTKLDEILEFFREYKVEHVNMRKQRQGKRHGFKGSVFAIFETKEASEAFLSKAGLKFGKTELLKERKKDYVKRKDEFYNNLREEKEKKLAEKRKESGETEVTVSNTEGLNTEIIKNCLLGIQGLTKDISREEIREVTEKLGKVVYIDYNKGMTDAVVRFDEGLVPDILTKLEEEDGDRKLEISSIKVKVHLIEGEDEVKYWQKINENKARARARGKNFHGGRGGGRFNKHGGGKRSHKRQWNNDEPPVKRSKGESEENDSIAEKTDKPSNDNASETME